MRKITEQAAQAFNNLEPFKKDNTEVKIKATTKGVPTRAELFLFGNKIAELNKTPKKEVLRVTNAGHKTNTTKERLNGLPGVRINQKAGKWYLNGEEWNGKLKEIKNK